MFILFNIVAIQIDLRATLLTGARTFSITAL